MFLIFWLTPSDNLPLGHLKTQRSTWSFETTSKSLSGSIGDYLGPFWQSLPMSRRYRKDIRSCIRKSLKAVDHLLLIWHSFQPREGTKLCILNPSIKVSQVSLSNWKTRLVARDVTSKLQEVVNRGLRRIFKRFWSNMHPWVTQKVVARIDRNGSKT